MADERLEVLPFDCGEVQLGIDVIIRQEAELAAHCAAFLAATEDYFGEDMTGE